MKLKLSEFFLYLVYKKSFYGHLASSLERVAKPGLGTMAVGIRNGRAAFFYDPTFVDGITLKAALFALEHEMLHLILDHIPRYLELLATCRDDIERIKARAVYNIGMDCSINTLLRNHEGFGEIQQYLQDRIKEMHPDAPEDPKNGLVLPEKFGLPLEGSFEFYQWQLMQKVEVKEIAGRLLGGTNHEMWTQSDDPSTPGGKGQNEDGGNNGGEPGDMIFDGSTFKDMSPEELLSQAHRVRDQLKQTLRSVVRSMGGIGRGTLPGGTEEWLTEYLRDPVIPWWEVFTTHARMSRTSKHRRSVSLPNRALLALSEEDQRIIPTPGRSRDKTWRIFLYVDTSGSMSTESLEIINSELEHMLAVDDNMEIRYMQGDCVTQLDVLLHTGDTIPREAVGRGGTDFDAYFIHMNQYAQDAQTAPDLVIVYTDGYAPSVDKENRLPSDIPVLWLVTPHHSNGFHEGYGEIMVCDPDHNSLYKK